MTRMIRGGAIAGAVVLALAACGNGDSGSADGEEITLELPSWQAGDGNFENWLRPLVEAFNEEHPDITVDLQHVPFDGFADQMTTRFAAGDPPEIVHLPASNFPEFADNGWLAPIDDRLAETDILESWIDLQDDMIWDDQYMGVLLLGYGQVLFYNQALFDEAGIDVPETPEQLVEAARTLTQGDVFGFGATTAQHPRNYSEPTNWLVGGGTHWATEDSFTVATPEVESVLETYRQALEFAPEGVTTQQRFELFSQGRIAMMFDGPFLIPDIEAAPEEIRDDLQVAMVPFDIVPGGTSNGFHIPSGLEPEVEDAVWSFIEFATTPEWQERYSAELGVPAPRVGVITDEIIAAQPRLEVIQEAADVAVRTDPESRVLRANYSEFSDIVGEQMMRMMTTDDDLSEILADLEEELAGRFDLQGG